LWGWFVALPQEVSKNKFPFWPLMVFVHPPYNLHFNRDWKKIRLFSLLSEKNQRFDVLSLKTETLKVISQRGNFLQ